MQVKIRFKKKGAGFYTMVMKDKESLIFTYGKARRVPPDKDSVFNSIPTKYITSLRIVENKHTCSICNHTKEKLVCSECIEKMMKSNNSSPVSIQQ